VFTASYRCHRKLRPNTEGAATLKVKYRERRELHNAKDKDGSIDVRVSKGWMAWINQTRDKHPTWFQTERCNALWTELEPELNQYGYSLLEMTRITRPVAFEGLATIVGFDTEFEEQINADTGEEQHPL
jgi:hypothetical protein